MNIYNPFTTGLSDLLKPSEKSNEDLIKLRKRQSFTDREKKTLLPDVSRIASKVEKLDEINRQLGKVSNKNTRQQFLEEYRNIDTEIKDFWDKRIKSWEKGLGDIENDKGETTTTTKIKGKEYDNKLLSRRSKPI